MLCYYFGDDFYRPDDQINSIKALKETVQGENWDGWTP